jgi:hypothetical protein
VRDFAALLLLLLLSLPSMLGLTLLRVLLCMLLLAPPERH